jgi:enamine deaminase RidA (YjgF/YER057c/UK114 family)
VCAPRPPEEKIVKKTDLVIPASQQVMYDRFHFAPAAWSGDLLLCSGQIGIGPDGRGITDVEKQFTAAFEGVKAILDTAGLGFADVVEITSFHVGLQQHLGTFMRVKDRYLPEPFPAWTAIGVVALAVPGGLVEVRATARRRAASRAKPAPRAAKKATAKKSARKRPARRKA